MPSPLKSPVAMTDQVGGMFPMPADEATCVPFMNHIAVLPATSRHSRSVVAAAVEVALPDQGPGGRDGADPCGRQDGRAVHQPHRGVAAGVAPGDVAPAVTVVVVGVVVRAQGDEMGLQANSVGGRRSRVVRDERREVAAAVRIPRPAEIGDAVGVGKGHVGSDVSRGAIVFAELAGHHRHRLRHRRYHRPLLRLDRGHRGSALWHRARTGRAAVAVIARHQLRGTRDRVDRLIGQPLAEIGRV